MSMTGCFVQISKDSLDSLQQQPELIENYLSGRGAHVKGACNVDKSWQTLHYLLSGDAWEGSSPEAQAILGGTEIGEDLGYGPARYLTPDEVQDVASVLSSISTDDLQNRFDADAMADADLYSFDSEFPDDELECVKHYYPEMQQLYQKAAQNKDAILLLLL